MFDNAETVTINNKEVKSIKLSSNNAILYEKPSLSLVTNKSTLSYHNSDVATLTATLTANGKGVANKDITFSNELSIPFETRILSDDVGVTLDNEFVLDISTAPSSTVIPEMPCIHLGRGGTYIQITHTQISLYNGSWTRYEFDGNKIIFEDNKIIYKDSQGELGQIDVSNYEYNRQYSGGEGVTYGKHKVTITTNANGIATINYNSCKAGSMLLFADSDDYGLQSNVEIHDYDYYPNDILLTASPNIIQNGDVSEVTAIVSDSNGDAIGSGQLVQFYKE